MRRKTLPDASNFSIRSLHNAEIPVATLIAGLVAAALLLAFATPPMA